MKLFIATRDFICNEFRIEEINPKYCKNVGINQVWEINNSNGLEAEVYVEADTLEYAITKAFKLFNGEGLSCLE